MWYEYVVVLPAVILSLFWLVRHLRRPRGGCDGCSRHARARPLQTDIPNFRDLA
jgi:hypothetical protein